MEISDVLDINRFAEEKGQETERIWGRKLETVSIHNFWSHFAVKKIREIGVGSVGSTLHGVKRVFKNGIHIGKELTFECWWKGQGERKEGYWKCLCVETYITYMDTYIT